MFAPTAAIVFIAKLSEEVSELKVAFGAPLVEKIGQPWNKDSTDFVFIVDNNV